MSKYPHAVAFETVELDGKLKGTGFVGHTITVQYRGHQIALVGATPEGAAAAFRVLTGDAPDMSGVQKTVMVSGKAPDT